MTIAPQFTTSVNILYVNMRRCESALAMLTGGEIKELGKCNPTSPLYEDLEVTGREGDHGGAVSVAIGDSVAWSISGYTHHFFTLLPATP
jgi:hypothetical protein